MQFKTSSQAPLNVPCQKDVPRRVEQSLVQEQMGLQCKVLSLLWDLLCFSRQAKSSTRQILNRVLAIRHETWCGVLCWMMLVWPMWCVMLLLLMIMVMMMIMMMWVIDNGWCWCGWWIIPNRATSMPDSMNYYREQMHAVLANQKQFARISCRINSTPITNTLKLLQ